MTPRYVAYKLWRSAWVILATLDQILLFHTESHLNTIKELCEKAENFRKTYNIDSDTAIMPASRNAIFRAAGSIVAAVDEIFTMHPDTTILRYSFNLSINIYNVSFLFIFRTAFCCTRPPGHHAEKHTPMGFCFLNNAGIAAKHAQAKFGLSRVAILVSANPTNLCLLH